MLPLLNGQLVQKVNSMAIIDLVTMKAYEYDGKPEENAIEIEIPDDYKEIALEKRNELIEAVAEFDDELMNKYLEGEEIPVDMLKKAIRRGTLNVEFFPVLCGTALGNTGIKLLLDAVVDYLPAPSDIESIKGVDMNGEPIERHPSDSQPFSALSIQGNDRSIRW